MDNSLFRYVWKYSRREQVIVLILIVISLPFYWVSFEIPKNIVNDAIQGRAFQNGHKTAVLFQTGFNLPQFLGGGHITLFPGVEFHQLGYLLALSLMYLLLMLINGWFKYEVNIRKGILGERMLRRLRFELFSHLMRFPPEEMRAVKAAEVTSMIKDEVDPIGGFIGDAFIQPAYLGTQALTAILFILMQNFYLGLAAVLIVAIQGVIIPRLRVEQIRLGRVRQLASRQMAGRIGEMIEGAPALHANGAAPRAEAEIGARLAHLFAVRVDLFRRKFFVKFLNNLLAQITPFFFFAIGGYFALRGRLDIGQLVAVIAAYRDLPPPIKELIDWDQQRNDVTVKYEQVVQQFTSEHLLPPLVGPDQPLSEAPEILVQNLRVAGRRGLPALSRMSVYLQAASHVSIVGIGPGAEAFTRVLGRQLTMFQGRVEIGGKPIQQFTDSNFSRQIAYTGPEPQLFPGTIRENILLGLQRSPPPLAKNPSAKEKLLQWESNATGNPMHEDSGNWIDYALVGAANDDELNEKIFQTLQALGVKNEVYRLAVFGRLPEDADPRLRKDFVVARHEFQKRLKQKQLDDLVEVFDPNHYHESSSIGENILFGVASDDRLGVFELAGDPYMRLILRMESLLLPLADVGLEIARWTIETFDTMRDVSAMVERFSLFQGEDLPAFQAIIDRADRRGGVEYLPDSALNKLLSLALLYIEPQHQLGYIDEVMKQRLLRARRSFRRFLPADYSDAVEFYDPDSFVVAAPISDNLLFGRIVLHKVSAEGQVLDLARAVVRDMGLDKVIFELAIGRQVGLRGRFLDQKLRVIVDLTRALIRQPKIWIVDRTFDSLSHQEAESIIKNLQGAMEGKMLLLAQPLEIVAEGFTRVLRFENTQLVMSADDRLAHHAHESSHS